MEFNVGQMLEVGPNTSGIIFYTNETHVNILNYDLKTKMFSKKFLVGLANSEMKECFNLTNTINDNLKPVYEEAMKYNELIQTYYQKEA